MLFLLGFSSPLVVTTTDPDLGLQVSLTQSFESNCDLLKPGLHFSGVPTTFSQRKLLLLWNKSWVGWFMAVIFDLFKTSSVLLDLFWDTSVYVLFKISQSFVWVEVSLETDSLSSENSIPAFKLHFRHLMKCFTLVLWGQCTWNEPTFCMNCSWSTLCVAFSFS